MQPLERLGHLPRSFFPLPIVLPVHKFLKVHAIDQNLRVSVIAKPCRISPGNVLVIEGCGFRAHASKYAYLFHLASMVVCQLESLLLGGDSDSQHCRFALLLMLASAKPLRLRG